jgi:hypothetical protein
MELDTLPRQLARTRRFLAYLSAEQPAAPG